MSKTLVDKCTPINYQLIKVGPTGPKGEIGLSLTGPQGYTGVRGATGATGGVGPTGLRGFTGAQGATGVRGSTGATGGIGPTGLRGFTGAQGIQGLRGTTGPAGPQGIQGIAGQRGLIGPPGAQGVAGRDGHISIQIKKIDDTYLNQNIVYPNELIVIYIENKPLYEDINEGAIVFVPSVMTEFGAYYQIIALEVIDRCWIQVTLKNIDDHESDFVEKEYMYFAGPRGPGAVVNGVSVSQVVSQIQTVVQETTTTVNQLIKPFHSLITPEDYIVDPYTGTNLQLSNFFGIEFNEYIKINSNETILNQENISQIIIKETGIYMIYGQIKTLYSTNDYGNRILVITKNGVEFQKYTKGTMDGKYSEINIFSVSDFFENDKIQFLLAHTTTDKEINILKGSNVSVTKIY